MWSRSRAYEGKRGGDPFAPDGTGQSIWNDRADCGLSIGKKQVRFPYPLLALCLCPECRGRMTSRVARSVHDPTHLEIWERWENAGQVTCMLKQPYDLRWIWGVLPSQSREKTCWTTMSNGRVNSTTYPSSTMKLGREAGKMIVYSV